jgi:hypothetical protein
MGVFDVNYDSPVMVEKFRGSNIYYIDNFYKKPDTIVKFLEKVPATVHDPERDHRFPSLNGVHFDDRRHMINISEIKEVTSYLSNICQSKVLKNPHLLITNKFRFYPTQFNDYKNNFWHPHTDSGYTALIYLNKNDNECGTNLYDEVIPDTLNNYGEHVVPWRPKSKWKIAKTLKPKFNRCVIFDGGLFPHGMHIPNDRYFGDEYRLNQVVFFKN